MQAQEECSQLERRLRSLEALTSELRESHAQRLADTKAEASQRLARISDLETEKASLADELRAQAEKHTAELHAIQEVHSRKATFSLFMQVCLHSQASLSLPNAP